MTDFEHALRSLQIDWPETPDIRLELATRRRRGLVVAAVALAIAVAAAFAVPDSRSAILRFFHLGGVTVIHVGTLPPAQERPLTAGLGMAVSDADARRTLGAPFLPRNHGRLLERDGFVSTVLQGPLLLSEFGSPYLIKKYAQGSVEYVEVAPGTNGLWIEGRHDVFFGGGSPRLAGNVLVWDDGHVTYRLEGPNLKKDDALRLARAIMGTTNG